MENQINQVGRSTRIRLSAERRGRLGQLLSGIALLGVGGAGVFVCLMRKLFSTRLTELLPLILFLLALIIGIIVLTHGLYRCFTRNTLFGRTAQTQLRGESLANIFTHIDTDMRMPCQCFGALDVGSQWIAGEGVMRMELLCGVFAVQVTEKHYTLAMVDVNDNVQMTALESADAEKARDYISSVCPSIAVGGTDEYWAFLEADSSVRYRRRMRKRPGEWSGRLAFWGLDGVPTSLYTEDDLRESFAQLSAQQTIGFTLLEPQYINSSIITGLFAERQSDGETVLVVTCEENEHLSRRFCTVKAQQSLEALLSLLRTGVLPSISGWKQKPWNDQREFEFRLHVNSQVHLIHTLDDVNAAIDGLLLNQYSFFALIQTKENGSSLFLDGMSNTYRIVLAIPHGNSYVWKEKLTERKDQVSFWVHNYYLKALLPYYADWENASKRIVNDPRFAEKL